MSRNKKVKNFKQYDSRWARVPYPRAPYYMADSGCGATACADIVVTNPKYKDKTPKNMAKFMTKRGYAIPNAGTAWAGITACLKHYGFSVTQHDDMASFFKEMKKTGRMAIIVFRGGSKGDVTWTLGGHFLACSGMEIKNGQHRLYMLDVGPRGNTGWFTYEKHMKGLVAQLWTCYLPTAKKEVKPVAKKKTRKELVAYARKRAKEKHKYKKGWSWKNGLMCHAYVGLCYKECGYPEVIKRLKKKGLYKAPWQNKYLGKWKLKHKASGLTDKDLQAGDIIFSKIIKHGKHIGWHSAIYLGDGKVGEALSRCGTHIGKLGKRFKWAFRVPTIHEATYEVTVGRKLRKSWTSKSEAQKKLPKGTKFKTSYKRGNWVKVKSIYNPKTKKRDKCSGWVCIKSKSKNTCKKIK